MSWFRRNKEKPDVWFICGSDVYEGKRLADHDKQVLVRLTKSNWPFPRGELMMPYKYNVIPMNNEDSE